MPDPAKPVQPGRLPFPEQVEFHRRKKLVPTERWTDLVREHHDAAFVVAGVTQAALLEDLHGALYRAMVGGTTIEQFRKDFDAAVQKHGWPFGMRAGEEDADYRAWRTQVIYETNLRTSYQAGRYRQMTDPEMLRRRPFWRYRHSGAAHPRLDHQAWNGKVIRADDPWWAVHYPPNGWGCGCTVESLSQADVERKGLKVEPAPPDDGEPTPWVDPVTGQREEVPPGLDPIWDYAPGATKGKSARLDVLARGLGRVGEPWRSQAVERFAEEGLDVTPVRPGRTWLDVVATREERAAYVARVSADERHVKHWDDEQKEVVDLGSRASLYAQFVQEYRRLKGLPVDEDEYVALRFYTLPFEARIKNNLLRGNLPDVRRQLGLVTDERVDAAVGQAYLQESRILASAMRKLPAYDAMTEPLPRGVVVPRGSALDLDFRARYQKGKRVTDAAFFSTGIGKGYEGDWQFTVLSRTGRHLQPYSHFADSENEVLHFPGTEFYVQDMYEENGVVYVTLIEL
ncbi:MAG: hypothetical protein LCH53_06110 [Bacteroidetes bacterium]|nr:hypothetical protein [Bacteroidota bacterium]